MTASRTQLRRTLYLGAAASALLSFGIPAGAEETGSSETVLQAPSTSPDKGPIQERQQYVLRLLMQVYDGRRDFSHTQLLGIGRVRQGDRSFTQFDFGDGAVVLTGDSGELAASRFMNLSPTEKGLLYDYRTKTIAGNDEIALFHNRVIRPLLGGSPELGHNAEWSAQLPLAELGLIGAGDATTQVELSREYFMHGGKPMVLIHYAIPAFVYDDASGRTVAQWGSGLSLTDPGFGMIYLNTALHRAVARTNGDSGVPYRYARTTIAANPDGSAMLDYRTVPQLAKYVDEFFSEEAMRVVPTGELSLDRSPITLARNLDLVSLSIAEDGANEAPITAGAQTSMNRGAEATTAEAAQQMQQAPDGIRATGGRNEQTQGAEAYTEGSGPVFSETPGMETAAEEATHMVQGQGGPPGGGGTTGSLADEVSPETMKILEQSRDGGSGLQGSLNMNADSNALFGGPEGDEKDKPRTTLDVVEGTGNFLNTVLGYTDKGNAITGGLIASETTRLAEAASNLGSSLNSAGESYRQASARLKNSGKVTMTLMPQAQMRLDRYIETTNQANEIQRQIDVLSSRLGDHARVGGAITPADLAEANRLVTQYNSLAGSAETQFRNFQSMDNKYAVTFDTSDAFTARLLQDVENKARDLAALERAAGNVEAQATTLQKLVQRLPTEKIGQALEYFGNSPAGKILDGVSHGMNAYTVGKSMHNTIDAAYNDKSSGNLNLARDHSLSGLALDLAALAGNAVSGNLPGFVSDATAITFGSVSDIFLSGKALKDTHQLNAQLLQQTREMDARLSEMRHQKVISLGEELEQAGVDLSKLEGEIDDSVEMSEALLEERRKAREEVRRQEEEARQRQEEQDRIAEQERQKRAAENERRRTANDRLKEAMKPDYPTARDRDPQNDRRDPETENEPGISVLTEAQQAEIEREERRAEAQKDLDAYQTKKLAERKAEEAERAKQKGTKEFRVSQLETSELLTSAFDVDSVEFEPPEWEPPEWEPPEWIPPEFDAPDTSQFPPTDPDDQDGYPGTGQYPAYEFENMSGTEPDISKWAAWLATQDIRRLEQLAIAAGYPSLAFALADAENIIRKSLDEGYRSYANRGPNCAGTTGCTGSIGPWKLAYATIRLGDILAQSREIFSTGGFSDVGISGFNLMYFLRDHGIQDGDIIDVEISQFGRVIFELRGHFLLTAGSPFNVNLRPGVAQMVITALNEGSASPNTAEVRIENVVRGEATQTYSLRTGQTAVLRIESNAKAGNGSSASRTGAATRSTNVIRSEVQQIHSLNPGVPPVRRIDPHRQVAN